jgi:flagellar hook-length control protein FliK
VAGVGGIAGKIANEQGKLVTAPGTIVTATQTSVSGAAPSSATASVGSTKSSQSLASGYKLTKEDFSRLKERLLQQGMKEQDVAAIEKQLDSGEGLTWKQFLQQVGEKFGFSAAELPATYGAEQKKALNDMFTTLGFTPAESASLISDLSQNKSASVLEKISEKLAALDTEGDTGVTNTQLCALAAGMKLSEASVNSLDAKMGGETTSLSKADVAAGLALVAKETNSSKIAADSKIEELKTVLGAGMQDAINRNELQKLSDNKETKDVQNAQIRIKESARENYGSEATEQILTATAETKTTEGVEERSDESRGKERDTDKAPGSDKSDAARKEPLDLGAQAKNANEQTFGDKPAAENAPQTPAAPSGSASAENGADANDKIQLDPNAQQQPNEQKNTDADSTAQRHADANSSVQRHPDEDPNTQQHADSDSNAPRHAGSDSSAKERSSNSKQQSEGFAQDVSQQTAQLVQDALKGKVEVKTGAGETLAGAASASTLHGQTANAQTGPTSQTNQASQTLDAQQTLKTVQNAVLNNQGDGSKTLSLQLEPENLGRITLILQVKNQELSALIKTESEDVTQALTQNMEQLRQSLEEQGLKVEKLDVQTQLNQDASRNSLTPDQHNQAQEQEMRNKMISSWRFLRGQTNDEDVLAHEMQSIPQQVKNSQQGLDLFA